MHPNDLISKHFRLHEEERKALAKLGLKSIRDLLYYFPARYGDSAESKRIGDVTAGEDTTIFGKIRNLKTGKTFAKKMTMAEGIVEDETGRIKVVWFNQPYIAKMIKEDSLVRIEGRVSQKRTRNIEIPEDAEEDGGHEPEKEITKKGELYMSNPKIETVADIPLNIGESLFTALPGEEVPQTLYPVYPETRGITSNWLYHKIQKIFKSRVNEAMLDVLPDDILEKYHLPSLSTALIWIHAPQSKDDALSARKRFSFEEIFLIQLKKQQERKEREKEETALITKKEKEVEKFLKRFPFTPTDAQMGAIYTVLKDFSSGQAMSRLLEGDVGSGKTLVAAATAFATYPEYQVAYMAPTEILARQHFESFISFFSHLPIKIALITGSGCLKFPSKVNPTEATPISRTQLLKWVKNGEISMIIGTHALISKSVEFKNLAYVVIDEQHRFGTAQRQKLSRKQDFLPHLLSMTATPIPRTLALTMYGDLDLTLLDQMPAGRKVIITEIIIPSKRKEMYAHVTEELKKGRQAYVICPRIDAPDPDKETALNVRSVKEEADYLKKNVFQDYEIEIMHSKMKSSEKEKVMKDFYEGKIDILVSTSVVEVGVNVPNATLIMIEGTERFGLSQLHQLRGRVLRGTHQAYCYVLTESSSTKSAERLKALVTAKNGFELAELDLSLRGAGQLYGKKQWGLSDLAMDALQNLKMVEFARNEARDLIAADPTLSHFPSLQKALTERGDIHFE
jgi:ATP-dependent DNA helicase RecG